MSATNVLQRALPARGLDWLSNHHQPTLAWHLHQGRCMQCMPVLYSQQQPQSLTSKDSNYSNSKAALKHPPHNWPLV
jgi:hypothetical protein